MVYETGPEAKQRLMLETATKGELGLKLCERHYFQHLEGSPQCIIRTAEQFNDCLTELEEEFDILDSLLDQLDEIVKSKDA